jgi:hypothetical protein
MVVYRSIVVTYYFEFKTPSKSRCTPHLKGDFQEKYLDNNYKWVNVFWINKFIKELKCLMVYLNEI